ncbi:hypothetical protein GOODEAATRI_020648, partial [Goodea atripinnis]
MRQMPDFFAHMSVVCFFVSSICLENSTQDSLLESLHRSSWNHIPGFSITHLPVYPPTFTTPPLHPGNMTKMQSLANPLTKLLQPAYRGYSHLFLDGWPSSPCA